MRPARSRPFAVSIVGSAHRSSVTFEGYWFLHDISISVLHLPSVLYGMGYVSYHDCGMLVTTTHAEAPALPSFPLPYRRQRLS